MEVTFSGDFLGNIGPSENDHRSCGTNYVSAYHGLMWRGYASKRTSYRRYPRQLRIIRRRRKVARIMTSSLLLSSGLNRSDRIARIIDMPSTRIAVVTGASSGIGRATAIALNAAGWTVVVTARREDALRHTVSLMPQESRHKSKIICGDMTKVDDIQELFMQVKREYGVYI